jgi:hypothetical protein
MKPEFSSAMLSALRFEHFASIPVFAQAAVARDLDFAFDSLA